MSKRYGKDFNDAFSPVKRAKTYREGNAPRRSTEYSHRACQDDVWGDDFDENAIEEMDFIVSQACSQDAGPTVEDARREAISMAKESIPSTIVRSSSDERAKISGRMNEARPCSQTISSSKNLREIPENEITSVFDDFRNNLLQDNRLNSTFCPRNDVILASDDTYLRRLERLEQENKKLLDDCMTKDGEAMFLRNQLQQMQQREKKEKLEQARFIEEQASRHRAELNTLHKQRDNLKTQNEFQSIQLGTLMERCKLLESGTVKFSEPKKSVTDSPSRTKFGSFGRSTAGLKSVRVCDTSVQTTEQNRGYSNDLKATWLHDFPLDSIPRSIFEPSLPEKSVIDIRIIEKIGRKNLPILQEEDTFRIFENPVLVKPIVTNVNNQKLNVEFLLPDVAAIMKKTRGELNSNDCIPIVNRIVATMRELLLNSTMVLETILAAMKNDDVRDMNDLYFSDFYENAMKRDKSICDSSPWYEKERGIEARRAMGVISYIIEASNYLCNYIAGKTRLIVENDDDYAIYIGQMIRYREWKKKGNDFEMLEMVLQFVRTLGLVRRSHQFSGLICAIVRTLYNVQRRIGFCPKGLEYVTNIFKEIVFSRPLLRCFASIARMMEVFCRSTIFARKLCFSHPNVKIWNGVLHFTPDACPLEIYMEQIERFRLDPITMIEMSDAFLSTIRPIILGECIPWITESSRSCNCSLRAVSYAINLLCECSRIDVGAMEEGRRRRSDTGTRMLDENDFWSRIRRKRMNALKEGIRFLSYLAKRDPDFIARLSDIEDSFHLFMQRVPAFDELILHENEQEALALIKLTLSPEKAAIMEARSKLTSQIFNVRACSENNPVQSSTSGQWYNVGRKKDRMECAIVVYRRVLDN